MSEPQIRQSRASAQAAVIGASRTPGIDLVEAPLTFVVDNGVRPVTRIHPPRGGETEREGEFVQKTVPILDGRALRPVATLDREGFALVRGATAVTDFTDEEQIRQVYYPEVVRLVTEATGAQEVLVFDHTIRLQQGGAPEGRTPVRLAHNDYTERTGPGRVRELLGDEAAESVLRGRIAQVNLWRPIRGPVESAPLAVADARSVAPANLIATDLVYPDRVGEIYQVAHSPAQRWYSYPGMTADEALLLKGYDSSTDGRARFTPHTAFDDPNSPTDAAPRESIEVRTFVFYPADPATSH